ncbi:MAG: hypothetical protein OXI30_00560 [Chloroflexota bacterium]|nr:hypothetical protein [Chloroflexota bacterium]
MTDDKDKLKLEEQDNPKRPRGRPPEREYPERIDASPEEIAEMVLRMPSKKPGEWRYQKKKQHD